MSSAAVVRSWTVFHSDSVLYKHLQNTCNLPQEKGAGGSPRYLTTQEEGSLEHEEAKTQKIHQQGKPLESNQCGLIQVRSLAKVMLVPFHTGKT